MNSIGCVLGELLIGGRLIPLPLGRVDGAAMLLGARGVEGPGVIGGKIARAGVAASLLGIVPGAVLGIVAGVLGVLLGAAGGVAGGFDFFGSSLQPAIIPAANKLTVKKVFFIFVSFKYPGQRLIAARGATLSSERSTQM